MLEDIALTVQNQLDTSLPFCAFNGGNDVFVDVGNKSVGLESLMAYVGAKPQVRFHRRVACCRNGAHGTAGHLRTFCVCAVGMIAIVRLEPLSMVCGVFMV